MSHMIFADGGCLDNGSSSAVMYGSFCHMSDGKTVYHGQKDTITTDSAWAMMFSPVTASCDRPELDRGTNNIAEYVAVLKAMEYAHAHKLDTVEFKTDSKMVHGQCVKAANARGIVDFWHVKDQKFMAYVLRVRNALELHPSWTLTLVKRDEIMARLGH